MCARCAQAPSHRALKAHDVRTEAERSADLARSVQTGPLGSLQCIHLEAPADAPPLPCWETADPIAMDILHTMTWACARQARDYLGVSEKTLARWRDSGLLKPGKHWRGRARGDEPEDHP